MTNLQQLAKDMRALGQMLIAQSEEIDSTLGMIDLRALAALVGNLGALRGGEPVAAIPFAPADEQERPGKSHGTAAKSNLTADQKRQIREHYDKLNPKDQTPESRKVLAKAYQISAVQLGAVLFHRDLGSQRHQKAQRAAQATA